jgi:8-oxo-dGTP diphosphatase
VSSSPRASKSPGAKDPGDGTGLRTGKEPSLTPPLVRAAGGVVWRRVPAGVDVVLVHRPAYDDWALPKGKLEPGETDEQAALREVREETGLSCRLGTELPSTTYADGQGRPKVVRYWSMTVMPAAPGAAAGSLTDLPLNPEPKASHEIDEACWVPLAEVRGRLTYPRDVVVLDALSDFLSRSDVRRQEVN